MTYKNDIGGVYHNNLLDSLKPKDFDLLKPHLLSGDLSVGTILYEPGDEVKYTYFPCGPTLISFMVLLDDARGVETALVGCEGALGGIVSHGRVNAYCRAMVQFAGPVMRIDSAKLEKAKCDSEEIASLFSRYADCMLAQVFQSVACNATHTIEQRTAKWLLAAIDRTGDHIVPLKQEQLAGMLGVGRSYVGRVMAGFKADGILETLRGKLRLYNIKELKKRSCNCNELVKHHFDEVLSGIYPNEAGVHKK